MFPSVDTKTTTAWQALQADFDKKKDSPIKALFKNDPDRFRKYSIQGENILFDFSKNNIDDGTLKLLLNLAEECGLKEATEAMFSGEKINHTEDRAVLHTALRNFSGKPVML